METYRREQEVLRRLTAAQKQLRTLSADAHQQQLQKQQQKLASSDEVEAEATSRTVASVVRGVTSVVVGVWQRYMSPHAPPDTASTLHRPGSSAQLDFSSWEQVSPSPSVVDVDEHDGDPETAEARALANLTAIDSLLKPIEVRFPRKPRLLLQLSIGSGPFNMREKDRHRYREQFEHFKHWVCCLHLAITLLNLAYRGHRFLDALGFFVQLYFYSSVTIRELILWVNRANIPPWWILHHNLCTALSACLLNWPGTESYYQFRTQLLIFNAYTSMCFLVTRLTSA